VGRTVQADSRRRVFVVHGHNKGPRDAVARLLVDLLLEPVILELTSPEAAMPGTNDTQRSVLDSELRPQA
jgi:predicted nucleotide-binding protein